MALRPGLRGRAKLTCTDADTAEAIGSGDVPVLGTPRIVALAEEATVRAVADELGDNKTTVGASVQLDHVAPTPPGAAVEAEATLAGIQGRRLIFKVSVSDERGLVAAGKITRVVVDRDRFVAKAHGED